jgi:hypothetical protein
VRWQSAAATPLWAARSAGGLGDRTKCAAAATALPDLTNNFGMHGPGTARGGRVCGVIFHGINELDIHTDISDCPSVKPGMALLSGILCGLAWLWSRSDLVT